MALRALIWDVDGTLAETERDGHLPAFNAAFEAADVPWRWSVERYGQLLGVTGGYERMLHDMADAARSAAGRSPNASCPRTAAAPRQERALCADRRRRSAFRCARGVRELMDDCTAVPASRWRSRRRRAAATWMRCSGAHLGAGWRDRFDCRALRRGRAAQEARPAGLRACARPGCTWGRATCWRSRTRPSACAPAPAAGVPVIVTRSVPTFPPRAHPEALAVGPERSASAAAGRARRDRPAHGRIDLDVLRGWLETA